MGSVANSEGVSEPKEAFQKVTATLMTWSTYGGESDESLQGCG